MPPTRHIEFQKGCAACALKRGEVVPTMLDIIKRVVMAVQPKRRPTKTCAPLKQRAVEPARRAQPVPIQPPTKLMTPNI